MKKSSMAFVMIVLLAFALVGCTSVTPTPEPTPVEVQQPNLPNPASANCIEKGGHLEIVTADDGSQSGKCIFPDGSSCEEWAFFRGECQPSTQETQIPAATEEESTPAEVTTYEAGWVGLIKSTAPGAQFDDYIEVQESGQVQAYGIDSIDLEVKSQIVELRDSDQIVHVYGTLITDIPDYNGSQIQVERIELE